MRRLSAILMIAALLAVLVPSATMARKPPPPAIQTVSVMSGAAAGNGCNVYVTTTWVGRVAYVEHTTYTGPDEASLTKVYGPLSVKVTNKDTSVQYSGAAPIGLQDVWWKVDLLDRKQRSLTGGGVLIGPDNYASPGGCPGTPIEVASYSASDVG